MILDSTVRKLQVVLSEAKTTNDCPVVAAWFDSGATPNGGPQLTNTNGVTAVDVVSAPASNYIRQVNELTVFNADTVSHGVTVRFNDNGTTYNIIKVTLLTGETLTYSKSLGWHTLDANGNIKSTFNGLATANLSDYSTGTWTPNDASGASLSLTINSAAYVKLGKIATVSWSVTYPSTVNGSTAKMGGLPFNPDTGVFGFGGMPTSATAFGRVEPGAAFILPLTVAGAVVTNANLSTLTLVGSVTYRSA